MKTKTSVKNGGVKSSHSPSTGGVKVQTNVKAGMVAFEYLVLVKR